jgi:raffinose/stachyose/melibiose transport system permease protein
MNITLERSAFRFTRAQVGRWVTYLILTIVLIGYLYPFWWIFTGSLKSNKELFANPFGLPQQIHWENYADAWEKANFSQYFFNTIYITVATVLLTNLFAGMAGYAMRFNFPGKKLLQSIIVLTMFLPAGYTIIPTFQIMLALHLTNTREAVIILITAGMTGFTTFLYWGYFTTLPREMEESAMMDGANFWQTFWHIMFPLARPMTATVTLLTMLAAWNDFFTPLIFTLNRPDLRTLPIGIYRFLADHQMDWSPMLAASLISFLPIVIVFIFLQRYFVEAIAGAVK